MSDLAVPDERAGSFLRDLVMLTKPRLNLLVVATTAGGYYLGAGPGANVLGLANVTLATALVAGVLTIRSHRQA